MYRHINEVERREFLKWDSDLYHAYNKDPDNTDQTVWIVSDAFGRRGPQRIKYLPLDREKGCDDNIVWHIPNIHRNYRGKNYYYWIRYNTPYQTNDVKYRKYKNYDWVIRWGTPHETNDIRYWRWYEWTKMGSGISIRCDKQYIRFGEMTNKNFADNRAIINTFFVDRLKKKCMELISELLICHDLEKLIMSYI